MNSAKQSAKPDASKSEERPRILVIDDEVETLALLKDQLEEHVSFHSASDGQEGYDQALALRPDCIVSDVNMPGLSGLNFLKKIRANATLAHTPVILLSALKEDVDRIKGYQALADLYLTKPYNAEELLVSILGLIRMRQHLMGKQSLTQSAPPKPLQISVDDEVLLERLERAVNGRLDKPHLNIEEIAQACFVSKRQLERKLKELKGISPAEYIRLQRMEQAWQWLEQRRYRNIGDLAQAVGYTSSRTFSRIFKKTFGLNPSDLLH